MKLAALCLVLTLLITELPVAGKAIAKEFPRLPADSTLASAISSSLSMPEISLLMEKPSLTENYDFKNDPYIQEAIRQIRNMKDPALQGIKAIIGLLYERANWVIDESSEELIATTFEEGIITVHLHRKYMDALRDTYTSSLQTSELLEATQRGQRIYEHISSFLAIELIEEASLLQYWIPKEGLADLPKASIRFTGRFVAFTYQLRFIADYYREQNHSSHSGFESFKAELQTIARRLHDDIGMTTGFSLATDPEASTIRLKYMHADLSKENIYTAYYFDFLRYFEWLHKLRKDFWLGHDDLTFEAVRWFLEQIHNPPANEKIYDVYRYLVMIIDQGQTLDLEDRSVWSDSKDFDNDRIIGEKLSPRQLLLIGFLRIYYYTFTRIFNRKVKTLPMDLIKATGLILASQALVLAILWGGGVMGKIVYQKHKDYQAAKAAYLATWPGGMADKVGTLSGYGGLVAVNNQKNDLNLSVEEETYNSSEPYERDTGRKDEHGHPIIEKGIRHFKMVDGIRLVPEKSYQGIAAGLKQYVNQSQFVLSATQNVSPAALQQYGITPQIWDAHVKKYKTKAQELERLQQNMGQYQLALQYQDRSGKRLRRNYVEVSDFEQGTNSLGSYEIEGGEKIVVQIQRPGKSPLQSIFKGNLDISTDSHVVLPEERAQLDEFKDAFRKTWEFYHQHVPEPIRVRLAKTEGALMLWTVLTFILTVLVAFGVIFGYSNLNLFHFRDYVWQVERFYKSILNLPKFKRGEWEKVWGYYRFSPEQHGLDMKADALRTRLDQIPLPKDFLQSPYAEIAPAEAVFLPVALEQNDPLALTAA